MRRSLPWALLLAALLLGPLGVAACGGGDRGGDEGGGGRASTDTGEPRRGGKLTVLWTDDVDSIDPGQTYYQMGTMVTQATQKPLLGYTPDDGTTPVPDLAAQLPQVSPDGRTVTVKLKPGVRFSPPVNREVTSADVKYAIERGFFSTVNNGYAGAYFGDVIGAKAGVKPGTRIRGITTPDRSTIVFTLSRGTGGVLAGALSMPLSAPVPESYARRYDAQNPSRYGQHQVATGPYMLDATPSGTVTGYSAGRRIHLVRNPSWDRAKDFKPAYLDEIDMPQGNDDTTVASRQVLTGSHMLNGDFAPPPAILAQLSRGQRDQLALPPTGAFRFVSLNTALAPFDDLDVRKAVLAGFNRAAMLLTRGGRFVADIPTHVIPPGVPGFQEAGGSRGFGLDFMSHPEGDRALAAKYFRQAGYASGRYEGSDEVLMVGVAGGVDQKAAEVAQQNLEEEGFKVRLRLVTRDAMYTRFCQVPAQKVQACPNAVWGKDFADAQSILDPTFNGRNILPQSNANFSQLDVPAINQAMARAETVVDARERARAWARLDRAVTEQAPAVLWAWDKQPLIASRDTRGVVSASNAEWYLPYVSLR
jgi:peptide/nickel transport system substrate-binding protein